MNEPIPSDTLASLRGYRDEKLNTGEFLRAVLANDLFEALAKADPENLAAIRTILSWVYNSMPSHAWGSYQKVDDWLEPVGDEELDGRDE